MGRNVWLHLSTTFSTNGGVVGLVDMTVEQGTDGERVGDF